MALKSVLKPDGSVMVGLANAAVIVAIYQASVPNFSDIRTAAPHNTDVEGARKRAAWKSAGVLGLVFLLTRDVNSALIGGAMLGLADLHVKHANAVHPATGKMTVAPGSSISDQPGSAGNETAFPMTDYAAVGSDEGGGY